MDLITANKARKFEIVAGKIFGTQEIRINFYGTEDLAIALNSYKRFGFGVEDLIGKDIKQEIFQTKIK